MEQEISPEVIILTQNTLGKYVKKPPLTEKLLRKPPFRFLHDIVTSVQKSTGFFEGLFSKEELISDNVKDRESKIQFLNKIITVLTTVTGKPLNVKPSKIVSGQEAEKTNELLQRLAEALDKKISSNEVVKKNAEKTSVGTKQPSNKQENNNSKSKNTNNEKLTSKSNESLRSRKKEPSKNEKKDSDNAKVKKETAKKESPPKNAPIQSKGDKRVNLQKKGSIDKKLKEDKEKNVNKHTNETESNQVKVEDEKTVLVQQPEVAKSNNSANEENKVEEEIKPEPNTAYERPQEENETPKLEVLRSSDGNNDSSAKFMTTEATENQEKSRNETPSVKEVLPLDTIVKKDAEAQNKKELKKSNSADTPSLQPSKPENVVARPHSVRPSSSRPGAPRVRDKHDNILSVTDNLLVGKVNIIAENAPEEEEDSSIVIVDQRINEMQSDGIHDFTNQRGHLVQQILESQKELTHSNKSDLEWHLSSTKSREATNQEMEQLRFNIQALSRVANPLGKLLDHIQEDVEVMRQELEQWGQAYDDASNELNKQKVANKDFLQPLHTKIKQLDVDIQDKHDKINDLKVVIHKNVTRINKLLANGKVQY